MQIKRWLQFRKCDEGATAVEFAVAFPMILFTSLAILELSMFYFGNQTITNTMNQSIRKGMIGCERSEFDSNGRCLNQNNVMRVVDPSSIRRHISRKTYGLVDACSDKFSLTVYPINGTKVTGDVNLGLGGDIVVYEATYDWPVFTPITWTLRHFRPDYNQFSYRTIVRNERFFRSLAMQNVRNSSSGNVSDCDWRGKNS